MLYRNLLTSSVSAAAMIVSIALPATVLNAQTTVATSSADRNPFGAEIVVTASSRITTAGFQAPTPTTVVGAAELRQGGRTDIQAALADLPQIRQTQSATTTNTTTGAVSLMSTRLPTMHAGL